MNVFEQAAIEYDEWFETHKWVYQSEVEAVRRFMPKKGRKANFLGVQDFTL